MKKTLITILIGLLVIQYVSTNAQTIDTGLSFGTHYASGASISSTVVVSEWTGSATNLYAKWTIDGTPGAWTSVSSVAANASSFSITVNAPSTTAGTYTCELGFDQATTLNTDSFTVLDAPTCSDIPASGRFDHDVSGETVAHGWTWDSNGTGTISTTFTDATLTADTTNITVTAVTGNEGSHTATFTLSYTELTSLTSSCNYNFVINNAPVSGDHATEILFEHGETKTVDLSGDVSDADSDALTLVNLTSPASPLLTFGTPSGTSVDVTAPSESGSGSFTYNVNDTYEDSETAGEVDYRVNFRPVISTPWKDSSNTETAANIISVDVLSNVVYEDIDVLDGDVFVTFTDSDAGDSHEVASFSTDAAGNDSVTSDANTLTVTPDSADNTSRNFSAEFTVSDSYHESKETAKIQFNVLTVPVCDTTTNSGPHTPVANDSAPITIDIASLHNCSTPEGSLSFSSISISNSGSDASLTSSGTSFTYTLPTNFAGAETIDWCLTNGNQDYLGDYAEVCGSHTILVSGKVYIKSINVEYYDDTEEPAASGGSLRFLAPKDTNGVTKTKGFEKITVLATVSVTTASYLTVVGEDTRPAIAGVRVKAAFGQNTARMLQGNQNGYEYGVTDENGEATFKFMYFKNSGSVTSTVTVTEIDLLYKQEGGETINLVEDADMNDEALSPHTFSVSVPSA